MILHLRSADQAVVITIDSFPFTVGRNQPELQDPSRQSIAVLESLRHISRRHATFNVDNNKIILIDEKTLNGTAVNGKNIGISPVEIFSDDVVCLASRLDLIVEIEKPVDEKNTCFQEDDLTVYANEATVFMDVVANKGNDKDSLPGNGKKADDKVDKNIKSTFYSLFSLLPSWKVNTSLIAVAAIIIFSIFYYRSGPQYRAKKYIKNENYTYALEIVNSYLAVKDKISMHDLGKKALMHIALPELISSLSSGTYNNLKGRIELIEDAAKNVKGGGQVLDTLLFIAHTEYLFKRNDIHQGIRDEKWRYEIHFINREWQTKKHFFHPVIDELKQINPDFATTAASFFSHINESRELELYEIDQLDNLEKNVGVAVKQGEYEKVAMLIKEYNAHHPNLHVGLVLQRDVDTYVTLEKMAEKHDAEAAYPFLHSMSLQTKVISDLAEEYIQSNYPSEENLRLLSEAFLAWREGRSREALTALVSIPDNPWSDAVSDSISTYTSMIKLMDVLDNGAASSEKCVAVCSLYKLAGDRDTYYKKLYANEFDNCRKAVELQVALHMEEARDLFGKYTEQGGITGQMRMEQAISSRYRSQANLLAGACLEVGKAETMMLEYDDGLFEQHKQEMSGISGEYEKQRNRLSESTVLNSALKQRKIDLLQQAKDPGNE